MVIFQDFVSDNIVAYNRKTDTASDKPERKRRMIKYFSYGLTGFDCLKSTVVGRAQTRAFVVAYTDDGIRIEGFVNDSTARVGDTLWVSPRFEANNGKFDFRLEAGVNYDDFEETCVDYHNHLALA